MPCQNGKEGWGLGSVGLYPGVGGALLLSPFASSACLLTYNIEQCCLDAFPDDINHSRRSVSEYPIHYPNQPVSVVSQCGADAWLNGLASGDQYQLTGSGSALEACSRQCTIQMATFTILYH